MLVWRQVAERGYHIGRQLDAAAADNQQLRELIAEATQQQEQQWAAAVQEQRQLLTEAAAEKQLLIGQLEDAYIKGAQVRALPGRSD